MSKYLYTVERWNDDMKNNHSRNKCDNKKPVREVLPRKKSFKERILAFTAAILIFVVPICCCCGSTGIDKTRNTDNPIGNVVRAATVSYSQTQVYNAAVGLAYNIANNISWEYDCTSLNIPYAEAPNFVQDVCNIFQYATYECFLPYTIHGEGYYKGNSPMLKDIYITRITSGAPLYYKELACVRRVVSGSTTIQKLNNIKAGMRSIATGYDANKSSAWYILGGSGNCQAYALFFQYMCDSNNINCVTIGNPAKNHMWNMVQIGNKWYNVDPCWDRTGTTNYWLKSDQYFVSNGHGNISDWKLCRGAGSYSMSLSSRPASSSNY